MSGDPEARPADDPEEFAEHAGTDPTAVEVDEYREKIGDAPADPPDPEPPPVV